MLANTFIFTILFLAKRLAKRFDMTTLSHAVSLSTDGDFLASATKTHDVHVWDLNESQLLAPPIPHSFPVNEVTMLDGKRVMVCSHHNVTIHSFEPTPSPVEDLQVASRAFTGNLIDATGLSTAAPETLVADWTAIQAHDAKIEVQKQQVSAWYDRLLMMLFSPKRLVRVYLSQRAFYSAAPW